MEIFGQIIACLLLADFITGLAHWTEDTYAVRTWPILRETIVEPNIQHHKDPSQFAQTSFWYRNKENMVVIGIITALILAAYPAWQIALVGCLTAMGNEVHAWSHKRPRLWLIRCLQDAGILQHPRQHAEHHRAPFARRYCVLTNLLNPLLDDARFWRGIEAVLSMVGIRVQRGTAGRDFV